MHTCVRLFSRQRRSERKDVFDTTISCIAQFSLARCYSHSDYPNAMPEKTRLKIPRSKSLNISREFSQMSAFELPDKFCCCSLKEGGKFVGTICIIFSTISCILLLIYLCSDFDAIAKEIADNSEEMVETLQESKVCKCILLCEVTQSSYHFAFSPSNTTDSRSCIGVISRFIRVFNIPAQGH